MSLERQLRDALSTHDGVEPSIDLWARVTESIQEDQAHRRRVGRVVVAVAATVLALALVGWLARTETTLGRTAVDWRALEVIETIVLALAVVALGPAVRRVGGGYAGAVFRANPATGEAFLRLVDLAYYLVFVGYVVISVQFESTLASNLGVAHQLQAATGRLAGLLVLMGILHGLTFLILPLVGLVFSATWHRRGLPRWINLVLVLAGLAVGLWLAQGLLGVVMMGL